VAGAAEGLPGGTGAAAQEGAGRAGEYERIIERQQQLIAALGEQQREQADAIGRLLKLIERQPGTESARDPAGAVVSEVVAGVALERRAVRRRSPKKEAILAWLVKHPADVSVNYRELPAKLADASGVKTNHVTAKEIQDVVVSRALDMALARGEQIAADEITGRLALLSEAALRVLDEIRG
jgi:hypothetical protein